MDFFILRISLFFNWCSFWFLIKSKYREEYNW